MEKKLLLTHIPLKKENPLLKEIEEYIKETVKNQLTNTDNELEKTEIKENTTYYYIENLVINFLKKYDIEENKQKFLDENLENLEEFFFHFLDDKKDNSGEILQKWIKELYWLLWNFYENIWKNRKALESYKSWIKSNFVWNYMLFWRIWELYGENKIKSVNEQDSLKLAFKNFDKLLELSVENDDFITHIYVLEKLWDLLSKINVNEALENYFLALKEINKNNIWDTNIISKILKKIINISDDNLTINHNLEELSKIDINNLIYICDYYEKKWKLDYTFFNYLIAIENNVENSIPKFINFLEKLSKEKDNNREIKVAIKNLENFSTILREDKKNIFLNVLEENFLENLTINNLSSYINIYNLERERKKYINEKIINNSIFLSEIIDFLSRQDYFDEKIKLELIKISDKVSNNEDLNFSDKKNLYKYLEIKNNPKAKFEYISSKIYSGIFLNEEEKNLF